MSSENGTTTVSKPEPENGTISEVDKKKIVRQIEYYFGDFNLPKDNFLQKEIKQNDGWVTLETMTNFKRLASITKDHKIIADALKKCPNTLMEVSEDGTKIRRNPDNPVPENMKAVFDRYEDRTLYVKGFPIDETLDNIQEFFDKCGLTVNTSMRRQPNKKEFKGSVFVSFKDKEDCDRFLTSDDFKCYKDVELIRKLRTDYVKEKNEARQAAKAKNAESRADAEGKKQEMEKARLHARMTLGALLELTGIPKDSAESIVISRIKAMMKTAGTPEVAFVETDKIKDGKVIVRFKEENSAAQALAKLQALENGLKFSPTKVKMDDNDDKADKKSEKVKTEEAAGDSATTKEKGTDDSETTKEEATAVNEEDSDVVDAAKDKEASEKEKDDLTARILVGEEEEAVWKNLLDERQQRSNKRRGGPRGRNDGPNRKRGRYSNRD